MGIKEKGFADWVAATFPDVVRELGSSDKAYFDTVCIDVNPLLHTCMRTSATEARFVKALFADLDRCLRLTIPSSTVYLAVDGSPPLAKMKEQIKRRRSKAPSKDKHLDSSQITPGCTFQLRVTEYLHYYAARYLATKNHPLQLRFIVDGAATAGEGEAKIMRYLYNNIHNLQERSVAVFSGDSDVVVQSLLSSVQDIYVLRPGVFNSIAISISRLRQVIIAETGGLKLVKMSNVIKDFSVMIMFSGNDYMHKLRGGRISKTWPVYKKFRQEAITSSKWYDRYLVLPGDTFDIEVLQELLTRIRRLTIRAAFVPDMKISLAMLGLSGTSMVSRPELESDESHSDVELDNINKEKRSPHYTPHIFNYLQSLLWTLAMYSTGRCPDVTFTQLGEYLSIEQILTFIARDIKHSRAPTIPEVEGITSLLTILCPISLLGVNKVHLVPASWRPVFSSDFVRDLCHSMINDATLKTGSERVKTLIYHIGQHVVSVVDPASAIIQLLTYGAAPLVLSRGNRPRPRWALPWQELGTSNAEIWDGVEIMQPQLSPDDYLFVREYVERQAAPEDHASIAHMTPSTWPFVPRANKPHAFAKRTKGLTKARSPQYLKP
ncbi:5'-3' exoribonuclease [Taphrina deformans PYCC 5710]|uniref:5'-3' exoribonuclease n=1 Tax=Taphrina deformans (strain PYCC 5710 / ATCC 11124 / CBS 356.35 / IMI 108563 / JCM 9778 / NBRC 8474) TaxID=1097556 RepID=R4XEQ8_TAPDE|nr:5'-3' exoribonuclease [Taphrina deformans PYCC 5710]|eukprot:CCG81852.1 5'-3' exoribonuclease [Taphrina deformans PYCC 5710]